MSNTQNFELACKEAVFHFNKGHLKDPTIPMWVVKAKGESYYVDHVECSIPWSTKETPNNDHTKGSLKIKRCLLTIDSENTAHLTQLTAEDEERLKKPEVVIRVITTSESAINNAAEGLQHLGIKWIGGACSSGFYLTEFNDEQEFVMFKLRFSTDQTFRELKPNEDYYKMYGEAKNKNSEFIDEDEWYDREDDYEYDDEPTLKQKMLTWFT